MYVSFVQDLYHAYAGNKKQLKNLYSSVKHSIYAWNGSYGPDLICIDDSSESYSILEQLVINYDVVQGSGAEEVLRFAPVIQVRFCNEAKTEQVSFSIDYIFKSYLFINDSSEEIRAAWYCFKKNAVSAERAKITYPLLKLLEHFFYCELYKDPKYKGLEFDDKFLLKSEFITKEDYPVKYRKGCHLVELIGSKKYKPKEKRRSGAQPET